jgi:hypothetical protein
MDGESGTNYENWFAYACKVIYMHASQAGNGVCGHVLLVS